MVSCSSGHLPYLVVRGSFSYVGKSPEGACQSLLFAHNDAGYAPTVLYSSVDGLCRWSFTNLGTTSLTYMTDPIDHQCELLADSASFVDWQSTPHLLQVLLVVAIVFMFVRGYDSGLKL